MGLPDRIADKIDVGDCWEWKASGTGTGYGQVRYRRKLHLAHRLVWEFLVGPIPEGLDLDHLCRNRGCCNPDHLEPVTREENLRRGATNGRKPHCRQGHPYAGDNLYVKPNGARCCRTCSREAIARHRAKKAAA